MARCQEIVYHTDICGGGDCSRNAVADDGTKCKQHSKAAVLARRHKTDAEHETKQRVRDSIQARNEARHNLVEKVAQLLEESVQPGGGVMISSKWRHELQALVVRAKQ